MFLFVPWISHVGICRDTQGRVHIWVLCTTFLPKNLFAIPFLHFTIHEPLCGNLSFTSNLSATQRSATTMEKACTDTVLTDCGHVTNAYGMQSYMILLYMVSMQTLPASSHVQRTHMATKIRPHPNIMGSYRFTSS